MGARWEKGMISRGELSNPDRIALPAEDAIQGAASNVLYLKSVLSV